MPILVDFELFMDKWEEGGGWGRGGGSKVGVKSGVGEWW